MSSFHLPCKNQSASYIYIYIYIYVYVYIYIYRCICISISLSIYIYVYVYFADACGWKARFESGGKMVASKCFYVRNRDGKDAVEIAKKRALEYIADIQGEATLTSKCRPELYNDDDDDDDDDKIITSNFDF